MIDTFICSKAVIIHNTAQKNIQQLKAEFGCDYIINGGLFNPTTFKPLMWLVLNGKVISQDQYGDWGLAIENGLPVMQTDRGGNYLSLMPLIRNGLKLKRNLTPDVAAPSARTAIGWTKDGKVILAALTGKLTREQLQDYMAEHGAVDALMCDGGGSAQAIFPSGSIASSRKVPTLVAFWAKKELSPQQKILELAKSQLGVKETPVNNVKYNTWYYGHAVNGNSYPWCMVFVQWVFANAGQTLPYKTASCSSLLNWYRKNHPECVHTTPEPGDIIIYDWGHTGIVSEVLSASAIKAIEGNTSPTIVGSQDNGGGVYERSRMRSKVTAYIRPYKGEDKVAVYLETLKKGSKGAEVKSLQLLLNGNGYSCGKADGDFGSGTETALKKFQKAKNLGADGVCGQATWAAILG